MRATPALALSIGLAIALIAGLLPFLDVLHAISLHGWIAIGLGSVLSFLLAGALMGLGFYSSRSGIDQDVDDAQADHATKLGSTKSVES